MLPNWGTLYWVEIPSLIRTSVLENMNVNAHRKEGQRELFRRRQKHEQLTNGAKCSVWQWFTELSMKPGKQRTQAWHRCWDISHISSLKTYLRSSDFQAINRNLWNFLKWRFLNSAQRIWLCRTGVSSHMGTLFMATPIIHCILQGACSYWRWHESLLRVVHCASCPTEWGSHE
jgi:hypothetical protein